MTSTVRPTDSDIGYTRESIMLIAVFWQEQCANDYAKMAHAMAKGYPSEAAWWQVEQAADHTRAWHFLRQLI